MTTTTRSPTTLPQPATGLAQPTGLSQPTGLPQPAAALQPLLAQVNDAIAEAKKQKIPFTPEQVRANLDKLAAFTGQGPDLDYARHSQLELGDRNIPLRIYSPAADQPLPVFIYFHGGGHMCGSTELYDPICRRLAQRAGVVVISVDYRLAPEHPYPAGIDDAYEVCINYRQILTALGDLAFGESLTLGGDSAGASITSVLAMQSQSDPLLTFDRQVLIYPCVDYTMSSPSCTSLGKGFLLEHDKVDWYFDNYFQGGEDRRKMSPLFGPICQALPSTLVITAGCDPLRDEGLAYFQQLADVGVNAYHYRLDDMIHAFINLYELVPEACEQVYDQIRDFVTPVP